MFIARFIVSDESEVSNKTNETNVNTTVPRDLGRLKEVIIMIKFP